MRKKSVRLTCVQTFFIDPDLIFKKRLNTVKRTDSYRKTLNNNSRGTDIHGSAARHLYNVTSTHTISLSVPTRRGTWKTPAPADTMEVVFFVLARPWK